MRAPFAVLLALASFAGCSDTIEPRDDAPPLSTPLPDDLRDIAWNGTHPTSFGLQGCQEYGAIYPHPVAAFSAPPGFQIAQTGPGQTFVLDVVYRCMSGPVPVAEQLLMIPVVPPAHLADPTARFQVLLLGGASQGAPDIYAAWGFGDLLSPGAVAIALGPTVTWTSSTPVWSAQATASIDGPSVPGQAGHARIFHHADGRMFEVNWSVHEEKVDGGAAVLHSDAPFIPASAAAGQPFSRHGSAYDWRITQLA